MEPCSYHFLSEDYLDIPIDFDVSPEELFPGDISIKDSCTIKISDRLYVLYVAASEVPPLNSAEYRYQYIPKCYGLQNDLSALSAAGILSVNSMPLNLTGKGVLMGFLDTGIRYRFPAFLNSDGTTRIAAVWDQTSQDGDPPEGFFFGTEYKADQINRNLSENGPILFTDEEGHGTKLISVACGYDRTNGFTGAARDADIAVVKLKQCKQYLRDYYRIPKDVSCYQDTDIMFAVKYLDQLAASLSKPLVICIAVGTSMGSHDGSGLLDTYLDSIARKRNRCVIAAGGNEGNSAGHYEGNLIRSPVNTQAYEEVELLIGENEPGFYMEIWGQIPGVYSISITAPGGEMIAEIPYKLGQSMEYGFIYSESRVVVDYVPVDIGNGQQLISLRFKNPVSGIWKLRIFAKGGGNYHAWLPIRQFLKSNTVFLRPSPYETITEPAYSRSLLAVSAYNSMDQSFYLNSGRGYSVDNQIVPDIAAPGVEIPTVLGTETGSSMAAAITAGAAADFMQWAVVEGRDRFINTPSIKNYFIRGADRKAEMYYPSREWGYGTLDLSGVFDVLAGL